MRADAVVIPKVALFIFCDSRATFVPNVAKLNKEEYGIRVSVHVM